jgi:hypothetical protein
VVVKEAYWPAKILPQFSNTQDFAGFLLDGLSTISPLEVQHLPHSVDDIVVVGLSSLGAGVINKEPISGDAKGVSEWGFVQRQAVVAGEHTW